MSIEREEYLRLKAAARVHEMSPERAEYLRLKAGQSQASPTLGSLRFEPPTQPAVTTLAPIDPTRDLRGLEQPEIGERPMGWGETAKATGLGIVRGALDVDPYGGSVLSKAVYPYRDEPIHRAGEALGFMVPYMGVAKAVGAVSKAPRIARAVAKLPGLARTAMRGVATGATAATLREGGRMVQGREADLSEIGKEAALFGATDVALRGGGRVLRKLLKTPKPKSFVTALVKDKPSEVDKLESYYKSISAPQKLTVGEAKQRGIALRQTKGGKIVPAVRRAGPFVPKEFAEYKGFKDVRAGMLGGTKDATRTIQEIDGALSVVKKAQLPGQAGPTEKYVLWRTRDISKMKINWKGVQEQQLKKMFSGISDKDATIANRVLERLSRKGAYVDPGKLALSGPISKITKDVKIIKFAQDARKYFESLLKKQNRMRGLRNQPLIPHRKYYTPHEIQRNSLWGEAFGLNKSPIEIMKKPGLPDYIKPNKPFNPRELARRANLPEYTRQMNLKRLLGRYTETASKDIFNTSIIQNNKAFAQQLETMGYPNAARFIQDWTAEAYAGVRPSIDRAVFGQEGMAGRILERGMRRFRKGLVRGVFPLNLSWNLFVQTSSGVSTGTRYGVRSSTLGLYDWLTKPALRSDISKNAYSYIVKTLRSGKITQQDINQGISRAVKLERGPLTKTADAFNYFTEWVERHLTGWSVASARRHGIKKGLKDKALWEYASEGGSKTQSMYNLEDLPGVLRNEAVKTPFPFQTFSFEVFNTMREFAGRTGTPPGTAGERIKWVLRFTAGAAAVNYVGKAAIGREPWEMKSFIPFYNLLEAIPAALKGEDLSRATARGQPAPTAAATQFAQGIKAYIRNGDISKLRRASIKYLPGLVGIPGGLQASRIVDGLIAISDGGMKDSAGKMMFPITDAKDKGRAFFSGPWSTTGGQEYWHKRQKSWLDVFKKKEVIRPKKREASRTRKRAEARR